LLGRSSDPAAFFAERSWLGQPFFVPKRNLRANFFSLAQKTLKASPLAKKKNLTPKKRLGQKETRQNSVRLETGRKA
jgi:hypothetical protein